MSSYQDWDKFDEEEELEKTDARLKVEDFKETQKKSNDASSRAFDSTRKDALHVGEALQAQAAVDALRALELETGGSSSRRRKNKGKEEVVEVGDTGNRKNALAVQNVSSSERGEKGEKGSNITTSVISDAASETSTMSKIVDNSMTTKDPNLVIITNLASTINKCSLLFSSIIDQSKQFKTFFEEENTVKLLVVNEEANGEGIRLLERTALFIKDDLKSAQELELVALHAGLLKEVQSSSQVLTRMKSNALNLLQQTTAQTALCALRSQQYALACDLARLWLKRNEGNAQSEFSKQLSKSEKEKDKITNDVENEGEGNNSTKEDDAVDQTAATLWMTRALALAGMRCPYQANVHCRQAQRSYTEYPQIEGVLTFLDQAELHMLLNNKDESFDVLMNRDLNRMIQVYKTEILGNTKAFAVDPFNIDVKSFATLFDIPEDTRQFKTLASDTTSLHMIEEGDVYIEDEDSKQNSSDEVQYIDVPTIFSHIQNHGELNFNILLKVIHEQFYQAQLLYLESMFKTSEIKYLCTIMLAATLTYSISKSKSEKETDLVLVKYVESVHAASLLNAGMCRVHRAKHSQSSEDSTQTYHEISALRLDTLTSASPYLLSQWGILQRPCVVALIRAGEIREKIQKYDEAIEAYDRAKHLVGFSGTESSNMNMGGDFLARYPIDLSDSLSQMFLSRNKNNSLSNKQQPEPELSENDIKDAISTSMPLSAMTKEYVNDEEKREILNHIDKKRNVALFKKIKYSS